MRINYNCPDDLLIKLDARAKELSMTRSAYMNYAISRQLETDAIMQQFPNMVETFNRAIEESKRVNK